MREEILGSSCVFPPFKQKLPESCFAPLTTSLETLFAFADVSLCKLLTLFLPSHQAKGCSAAITERPQVVVVQPRKKKTPSLCSQNATVEKKKKRKNSLTFLRLPVLLDCTSFLYRRARFGRTRPRETWRTHMDLLAMDKETEKIKGTKISKKKDWFVHHTHRDPIPQSVQQTPSKHLLPFAKRRLPFQTCQTHKRPEKNATSPSS